MVTLKQRNLQKRVTTFLQDLNRDEELRTRLIQNPTSVIAERFRKKISHQRISRANQLLFSLISNEDFRKWISDYSRQNQDNDISSRQFVTDFTQAVIRFGDEHIVRALVSGALIGNAFAEFSDDGDGDGEPEPPSSFAKQYSWAVSDGFALYNRQYAWTQNKTTGLEFDPYQVITPEMVRSISEQLVARGSELRQTTGESSS